MWHTLLLVFQNLILVILMWPFQKCALICTVIFLISYCKIYKCTKSRDILCSRLLVSSLNMFLTIDLIYFVSRNNQCPRHLLLTSRLDSREFFTTYCTPEWMPKFAEFIIIWFFTHMILSLRFAVFISIRSN